MRFTCKFCLKAKPIEEHSSAKYADGPSCQSCESEIGEEQKKYRRKMKGLNHVPTELARCSYLRTVFSRRLKQERCGWQLSQRQLSELTGISKSNISKYENAQMLPSVRKLKSLAAVLGTTTDNLLNPKEEDIRNM